MKNVNVKDIIEEEAIERLRKLHADDVMKPAFVPPHTLGIEMVEKIPIDAIKENVLVVSDLGLLLSVCTKLFDLGCDFSKLIFLCHTENIRDEAINAGIRTWYVPYNKLGEFFSQNKVYVNGCDDYIINDMKFSCVIGNPPYNGVSASDVPKEIKQHLKSGYNTYYAFILKSLSLLEDGGELTFVTPREWLCSKNARSLREKILSEYYLADVSWIENPWGSNAATGIVSVFRIQKSKKCGYDDKFCVVNGAIAQTTTLRDVQILKKITSFLSKFHPVEFFRGGKNSCEECEERDYVETYVRGENNVVISQGKVKGNDRTEKAIQLGIKYFVLYPEFTFAHKSTFLVRKAKIVPMPVNDTMIIVPTNTPEKHAALLESSTARFLHSMFFSTAHLANSLQGFLPDITTFLPEQPKDGDIFNIFGLTVDEQKHIVDYLEK